MAKKLVESVCKLARENGYEKVEVHFKLNKYNEAYQLFRALGFEQGGYNFNRKGIISLFKRTSGID